MVSGSPMILSSYLNKPLFLIQFLQSQIGPPKGTVQNEYTHIGRYKLAVVHKTRKLVADLWCGRYAYEIKPKWQHSSDQKQLTGYCGCTPPTVAVTSVDLRKTENADAIIKTVLYDIGSFRPNPQSIQRVEMPQHQGKTKSNTKSHRVPQFFVGFDFWSCPQSLRHRANERLMGSQHKIDYMYSSNGTNSTQSTLPQDNWTCTLWIFLLRASNPKFLTILFDNVPFPPPGGLSHGKNRAWFIHEIGNEHIRVPSDLPND